MVSGPLDRVGEKKERCVQDEQDGKSRDCGCARHRRRRGDRDEKGRLRIRRGTDDDRSGCTGEGRQPQTPRSGIGDLYSLQDDGPNPGGVEEGVAGAVAKVDISTVETYEGVVAGKQGQSNTFTLDGTTAHTITFIEVGITSATFTIESDPIEVTLDVGKSSNVDLDGDGTDDIKVTLTEIDSNGLAKLEVINLAKEEEKKTGVSPDVPISEAEGKAGLWITILVILAIICVGYYLLKGKKGKKGQVKFSKQDLGL